MANLPTVGGDSGNWGTILNTYLLVEHNANGTHSSGVGQTANINAALSGAASPSASNVFATAANILAGAPGGATVADQVLKAWTESGAYELTSVTYDSTYTSAISSGTVKWPDGSAGTFTATTINSTWGKVDAYTISHTASGKTVTQAAVTRDSNGLVTGKPALTVA